MTFGSSKDDSPAFGAEVKCVGSFASCGPRLPIRGSSLKEIPSPKMLLDCLEASTSLGSGLSMRDLSATEILEYLGEIAGLGIGRVESTWAVRSVSLSPCSAWGRLSIIKSVSG